MSVEETVKKILELPEDEWLFVACVSQHLPFGTKELRALARAYHENRWRDVVSDGLPTRDYPYEVTLQSTTALGRWTDRCAHREGVWFYCDVLGQEDGYLSKTENVIAYRPLAAPYLPPANPVPEAEGDEG